MIVEAALTGTVRYEWRLLSPVLHHLVDSVLNDFSKSSEEEVGPPRPMPGGQTLESARASLHSLLDGFAAPPFTFQRLCELLLEPRKQYTRLDKIWLAIERLLLVTSTLKVASSLPPPPTLDSLGPVNENPPSPYDGEPPAPLMLPSLDQPSSEGNGSMLVGEYAVYSAPSSQPMPMMTSNEAMAGPGPRAEGPPPLEPADAMQAERFAKAALAGGSPESLSPADAPADSPAECDHGQRSEPMPEVQHQQEEGQEPDPQQHTVPGVVAGRVLEQETAAANGPREGHVASGEPSRSLPTGGAESGKEAGYPVTNGHPVNGNGSGVPGLVMGVPVELNNQGPAMDTSAAAAPASQ